MHQCIRCHGNVENADNAIRSMHSDNAVHMTCISAEEESRWKSYFMMHDFLRYVPKD